MPVVNQLRSEFKGTLLAYSVEVDEANVDVIGNLPHNRAVEEIIRSIDAVADHEDSVSTTMERSTWVAIKLVRLNRRDPFDAYIEPLRRPYFQILSHWLGFQSI